MSGIRDGITAYGSVLRRRGVGIPVVGTCLASLPIGMLGLAVILLVGTGEAGFSATGAVVGALGLGTGIGLVVQGRLMDRLGHTPVLLGAICVQVPALTGLVVSVRLDGPPWLSAGLAFLAGVGEPQVGGSLRALWSLLLPVDQRHTGVALSSILFEVPVMLAPLLLYGILTVVSAATAVLVACGCFAVGAALLATSRAARAWRPTPDATRGLLGPLTSPGVRLVTVVAAAQGTVTGLLHVSYAAFAEEQGAAENAAVLFALVSGGSLLGTVVHGARQQRGNATRGLAALLGLSAAVFIAGASADSPVFLGSTAFAAGLVLGPIAVRCFTEAERHAPPGTLAGAFTTLTAAGLVAMSAGTALAGWLIDHHGVASPHAMAAVVTLAAAVLLVARPSRL